MFKWAALLACLGIALEIIGFGVAAWLARPSDSPIQSQQLTRVTIAEPGYYTLWEESAVAEETNPPMSRELPSKSITIRRESGGALPTEEYSGFSIKLQSIQRNSRMRVHVDQPGEYQVLIQGYPDKSLFHLLPSHPFWYFFAGVVAILLGLPVLAAALILAIIGAAMRISRNF